MIDLSMLQDFLVETGEHLEEIETNLLQLEADPGSQEIFNHIFRSVHTIKGGAEYMGMERIAELSHMLESLLEMLRHGERPVDRESIDIVMSARDRIVMLVADLERSQEERTEIKDLIDRIGRISSPPVKEKAESAFGKTSDDQKDGEDRGQEEGEDIGEKTFEEEYDDELFEIFMQQLKEGISLLRSQIEALRHSDNGTALLNKCLEIIDGLKSAANYMDYRKLTQLYEHWAKKIKGVQERLALGEAVSLEFMDTYLNEILKLFPKGEETEVKADAMESPAVQEVKALKGDAGAVQEVLGSKEEKEEEWVIPLVDMVVEEAIPDAVDRAFDAFMAQSTEPAAPQGPWEDALFSQGETVSQDEATHESMQRVAPGTEVAKAVPEITEPEAERRLQKETEAVPGEPSRPDSPGEKVVKYSVRVDARKIDALMSQASELVVGRAGFSQLFTEMRKFQ